MHFYQSGLKAEKILIKQSADFEHNFINIKCDPIWQNQLVCHTHKIIQLQLSNCNLIAYDAMDLYKSFHIFIKQLIKYNELDGIFQYELAMLWKSGLSNSVTCVWFLSILKSLVDC